MFNAAVDIHGETITVAAMTPLQLMVTYHYQLQINAIIKIDGDDATLVDVGLERQSQEVKITSGGISLDTLESAQQSISSIDKAIEQVSQFRSSFGAVENRIDASLNNLTTLQVNTQAAVSRIQDADFAAETSNLTKNQILAQAATSMLAQANASKQNLLALLQG